jgi:hypothetical protein
MKSNNRSLFISIFSSIILILFVGFWNKIWSELWMLGAVIGLIIFIIWFVVLIKLLFFLSKNNTNNEKRFYPLLVHILTLLIIVIFPLNWLREYAGFILFQNQMEYIVKLVEEKKLVPNVSYNSTLISLPGFYSCLSVGGGQIIVEDLDNGKAVFFYTFRGTPDGRGGFVHISEKERFDNLQGKLFYKLLEKKELGNNWYYIMAD